MRLRMQLPRTTGLVQSVWAWCLQAQSPLPYCRTSLDRIPASIVKARRRQIRFIRTTMLISPLFDAHYGRESVSGGLRRAAKWFRPEAGKKARNALARERLDHSSGLV